METFGTDNPAVAPVFQRAVDAAGQFLAAYRQIEIAGLICFSLAFVLWEIAKAVAPNEVQRVLAQLWTVWCWVYSIRWKIKREGRHKLFFSIQGALFVASFYVLIEVGLAALNALLLKRWRLPDLDLPPWLELPLFVLSLIMVRHHWLGWKHRRLNDDMPQITEILLRKLEQRRAEGGGTWTPHSRERYLKDLMEKMEEILQRDRKRRVDFSLMERNQQGELAILYSPKKGVFPSDYTLQPDEGAAGAAYTRKNSIYIPSTEHLIAIDLETNETIGQIYKADPPGCPFHCVLCVPIIDKTGAVMVLNISCTEKSSFDLFEFSIGRLMSAIIAMMY